MVFLSGDDSSNLGAVINNEARVLKLTLDILESQIKCKKSL